MISSSINTSNKDVALALASLGLHTFPCGSDKKPRVASWEQAASASLFDIAVKWDASPELLPGLPVGAHGLVVIDADRKAGGPDGVDAFTALCAEHGIDPSSTLVVETPSGGFHFYFRTDVPYGNSSGSLPDGIDVRGKGGYTIAPGATLPDGRGYRIVQGSWDAIQPLPDALAAFLREKQAVTLPALTDGSAALSVGDREREYAQAALADEVAKLAAMSEGTGRNAALNNAAFAIGTMARWIDLNEAADSLLSASIANGYVAKDGQAAVVNTITSGINAGRLKPRALLSTAELEDFSDIMPMIETGIAEYKRKNSSHSPSTLSRGRRSVTILQGSNIVEESIDWLWEGYLPKGKLTLLAGAGGTGKSTIAFHLAATITNGGLWPDGTRFKEAGNVLIWSSEDDPADTIKPRLMAVGANDRRYGMIAGTVDENNEELPFDPATDIESLREAVANIGGVSLLIIDPIVTAITGDMHKANDVRRSLQTIVNFAAECNCAVLGITHFAKGTAGKNSAERVIGSQAFAAFARMVLVAAKEEESDKRVFTRAKSNNSIDTGGYSYSIEALTLHRGIVATRVVWGEALEGSSRSILSEVEGDGNEGTSKLVKARKFLLETLANGPTPSKELFTHASEGHGISKDTLRRAQEDLKIIARKLSMSGGWVWALPDQSNTY